ncbi:uncharacterized protein LOC135837263 [Planococcus citri]|uniref:uncharacterized protein LOC135837263 n=1 Tax=Planococcus citri TaxID=170843 RepID=UPI0031F74CC7
MKIQGSKKTNTYCPASIKVSLENKNKIVVKFTPSHIGHENELRHIYHSPTKQQEIAAKLSAKIPPKAILEEVRNSLIVSDASVQRIHLLTQKDIHNIAAKYNIGIPYKQDQNPAVSVHMKIEELKSSEDSVLFYKTQGVCDEKQTFLKKEDFVLIMMNAAQSELLKKFGSDVIAIDGTHGMGHDFELFSIIVLDELRQGLLCAFMITNRKDEKIFEFFYNNVKSRVGNITPNVFMSDMADELYSGWCKVMGESKSRLYCTWHVDRAWQQNLTKIKNTDKRPGAYKLLRTCLEELDQNKFNILIVNVANTLKADDDWRDYGIYFDTYYVPKAEYWAYCFRRHAGVNTNMHLERIHKSIKYLYLDGKVCKRLDKSLHALLQYIRDRLFDRFIMLEKGKLTSKAMELRKRHRTAEEAKDKIQITSNPDDANFIVTSQKNIYYVTDNVAQCDCKLRCPACCVCIHRYNCTCIDSMIKFNMCKHIHLVCNFVKEATEAREESLPSTSTLPIDAAPAPVTEILSTVNEAPAPAPVTEILRRQITKKRAPTREELEAVFNDLLNTTATSDEGREKIMTALKQCSRSCTLPLHDVPVNVIPKVLTQSSVSARKKITQQLRFVSTKKSNTKRKQRAQKPCLPEQQLKNSSACANARGYVADRQQNRRGMQKPGLTRRKRMAFLPCV